MRVAGCNSPWEEVQPRDRRIMRITDDRVQPTLLQVPDRNHASAPACCHEGYASTCNHMCYRWMQRDRTS